MINDKFLNDVKRLAEANYINDKFDREEGVNLIVKIMNTLTNLNDQQYSEFVNVVNSTHYQLKLTHIDGYFSDCIIDVSVFDVLDNVIRTYSMEFGEELRGINYCECEDSDEGYNAQYGCCGVNCDWYIPYMEVNGRNLSSRSYFKGLEKDLWKLEEDYKKELTSMLNSGNILV